jgi:hypothetical protein
MGRALRFICLFACAPDAAIVVPPAEPPAANPPEVPTWDKAPEPPECAVGGPGTLLDQALEELGLTTLGFSEQDLNYSGYARYGALDDSFVLPSFKAWRAAPERLGCVEDQIAGGLGRLLGARHKVASMIRHVAPTVGIEPLGEPLMVADPAAALQTLCAMGGGDCVWPALDDDLNEALGPIFWAMQGAIRAAMQMTAFSNLSPDWWHANGGGLLMVFAERPDLLGEQSYLLPLPRRMLVHEAARLAFAVEHVDWSPFVGRDVTVAVDTPFGLVRVSGGGSDVLDAERLLFSLDLGGDDTYRGPVGANASGQNPVSLAIDLEGDDRYGYEVLETLFDQPRLPPADAAGRYPGDANYGPISRSVMARQGAARNGVAMLFDLAGDDQYASLVASQGYAAQGVGVLFDGAGNDTYVSETLSQGAAQFGIALAVDAGKGDDSRSAFSYSQGFGFIGGFGALVDGGGNDHYRCDHGDAEHGGLPLYASAQLPGSGNNSMCQGFGFGLRQDAQGLFASGGIGVLRDEAGDDDYEVSVFGQGAGYWQGTGFLSDGDGADRYEGRWYVQGSGAHYAVGLLREGGSGDDTFNEVLYTHNVTLGSGHDYSVGVLLSEGGSDTYHLGRLAVGTSNCNGVGLFADNSGDDTYISRSSQSGGLGNVSSECKDTRSPAVSIGVMLEGGGSDAYQFPEGDVAPADDSTWFNKAFDLDSEYGIGIDASAPTGLQRPARVLATRPR